MQPELKEMFLMVIEAAVQFADERTDYIDDNYTEDDPYKLEQDIKLDQLDNAIMACQQYIRSH